MSPFPSLFCLPFYGTVYVHCNLHFLLARVCYIAFIEACVLELCTNLKNLRISIKKTWWSFLCAVLHVIVLNKLSLRTIGQHYFRVTWDIICIAWALNHVWGIICSRCRSLVVVYFNYHRVTVTAIDDVCIDPLKYVKYANCSVQTI